MRYFLTGLLSSRLQGGHITTMEMKGLHCKTFHDLHYMSPCQKCIINETDENWIILKSYTDELFQVQ